MMTPFPRSTALARSNLILLLVATALTACVDDGFAPDSPPARPGAPRVLGFFEITFDGIGTPNMTSSALAAPSLAALEALRAERDRRNGFADEIALDLSLPRNDNGSGDGTIQLAADSSAQFVYEGNRYLHASYQVRNAQLDGAPYDTDRTNLTFYGVSAEGRTIDQTAVLRLRLDDGSQANPALASQVLPTGLAVVDDGELNADHPDVLQVLTEAQIGALTPPQGVTTVFPYGFVVRHGTSNNTRTLPASPGPSDFEGVVDFAIKIPSQLDPTEDPQTLSLLMLAVDDSEVWITQSLEEQHPDDWNALRPGAGMLNAIDITLLPGGSIPGVSNTRRICTVRTAGSVAVPTAHLVNVNWNFQSFIPADGSSIFPNADFQAQFDAPVEGAGPTTFRVFGQKSGPAFHGQTYQGNGTATITTPTGAFTRGERVQIYLTSALACPDVPPRSYYRVQSSLATGAFQLDASYDAGDSPAAMISADLTGDGILDLALVDTTSQTVSVLLGNSGGTFQLPNVIATGDPSHVAVADKNDDGILDLVFVDQTASTVSVLVGAGDGTFPSQQSFAVGANPRAVVTEDLDSDGLFDAVVINGDGTVSVLAGNGDGTLHDQQVIGAGATAQHVSVDDLNGDGVPDLAFATNSSDVSVLLGNGDGTFQAPLTSIAGQPQQFVATGDLDGDGSRDLVFTASSQGTPAGNSVHVMLGSGNGTFQEPPQQFPTGQAGANAGTVEITDFTGDNVLDLVTPNLDGTSITVFLGAGDGTFPTVQSIPVTGEKTATATGDFDGDTVLDVAVATSDGLVWVLLGQAP